MISCPGSPRTRTRPIRPASPMRFLRAPRSILAVGASDRSGWCPSRVWMTSRPAARRLQHRREGATAALSRLTSLPSVSPKPAGSRKSRCMSMKRSAVHSSAAASGYGSAAIKVCMANPCGPRAAADSVAAVNRGASAVPAANGNRGLRIFLDLQALAPQTLVEPTVHATATARRRLPNSCPRCPCDGRGSAAVIASA